MPFNIDTGRYYISDLDIPASGAGPNYYGYVTPYNSWYIMQENVNGTQKNYLYARGNAAYATNWAGRTGLTYNAVTTAWS